MSAAPDLERVPDRVHERGRDGVVRDPAAHDRAVRAMFARIARVYDFMNHALSFNRDRAWRRDLVRALDPGTELLVDLCSGTGDLGLAALRGGRCRRVVAADFTPAMLAAGRGKGLGGEIPAVAADAQALPLRDGCADAVAVGFGVRNLADLRRGLAEMRRVLKPGGRLLVLDFFRDDPAAAGAGRGAARPLRRALDLALPAAGRLLGRDRAAYAYLADSRDRFVTPAEFAALLDEFGFRDVLMRRQTFGIAHLIGGRLDVDA